MEILAQLNQVLLFANLTIELVLLVGQWRIRK
jgi:hypothetical protein